MELMKLNTNTGIAGIQEFKGIDDVLSFVPFCRTWDWSGGHLEDRISVTAVLADGNHVNLKEEIDAGDAAAYSMQITEPAETVGVQIAGFNVQSLIFERRDLTQDHDDQWEEYLPVTPLDWGKIRRKIEDALRKTTDNETLFGISQILGVKTTGEDPLPRHEAIFFEKSKIPRGLGATSYIKILNKLKQVEEEKADKVSAEKEVGRLASLLYKAGITFTSNHPEAKKFSLASRAPKEMKQDILEG